MIEILFMYKKPNKIKSMQKHINFRNILTNESFLQIRYLKAKIKFISIKFNDFLLILFLLMYYNLKIRIERKKNFIK